MSTQPKQFKKVKPLTPEQQKQKAAKQKINGQVVCAIMMMSMGIMTSPKLLGAVFDKERYPTEFQIPSLITYIACTSGYIFALTIMTMLLRVKTKKSIPAEREDPASIISMNQLIKNAIVYTFIFLGLYFYLSKNWKKDTFILELTPFVLFGTLIFEFALRLLEFLVDIRGIRYLAQSITLFMLCTLSLQALSVGKQ